MDAFFASVEQLDNPSLKGKPVAVGGSRERGVVAAASYEARKFGVRSAQASVIAARLCPELIFVSPRFDRYKEISTIIRSIFLEYTDLVEPLSLDEAFLDVTRNHRALPSATLIAEEIRKRIFEETGLTASAGVSVNKFVAKVASDMHKPNGLTLIPPNRVDEFTAQLKIERFFGIGKVTAEKMKSLGIHTGMDLRSFTRPELVRLFGKAGRYYFDIARGIDERSVKPNRSRKSIGAETTFHHDSDDLSELKEVLQELCSAVHRRMQQGNHFGRTISIKIRYSDFQTFNRSKTLEDFTNDKIQILRIAEELLEAHPREQAIRLLGVTLSNLNIPDSLEKHGQLTMEF